MEALKRFKVPVLTGLGVVVLAAVLFLGLISPQGKKLSGLKAQETTLQAQQVQLQAQLAVLRRDKAQMAVNCATLAKAQSEIPATPSVDSFLQQVTALAVASGDPNTPTIAVTQAPSRGATGVSAIQVSLTLNGSYGQMMAFLRGLDSFPRLFTIGSISVAGGPVVSGGGAVDPASAGYTLTLSGAVYYAGGQPSSCGTRTASAGSGH